ncbi:MAG TPA: FHA domain-containing protein [Gemmataceae bacterium]|jgi:predicted component of type VI protein secretion system|nr:FHA domain-containing protein [Gemmataceae bacterium]
MKLTLVVLAAGQQQGKLLNIPLPQFLIGRDPQCHLRPASALISKRHCALIQRDGKAFVRDFDSTNGTFLNEQPVKGEVELHHDDQLKVGPLMFAVRLEAGAPAAAGATPPPPTKAPAAKAPATATLPAPKAPAGAVKAPAGVAKAPAGAAAAPPSTAVTPEPAAAKAEGGSAEDDIAAMLLSLQDDTDPNGSALTGDVPEGSTVHDLTVPQSLTEGAKSDKDKEKKAPTGNTSSAAKSILEKYMRRPRNNA